jgi:hypothetical protein
MRILALAIALAGSTFNVASASDPAPVSETVKLQMPQRLVSQLPAPRHPGDARRAFESHRDKSAK